MNNLIVTVSLALIIGKSHCQLYGTPVPNNQQATGDNSFNGPTTNTTNALSANGSGTNNATYLGNSSLNSTVALNTSVASNASALGNTSASLMGNSSISLSSSNTTTAVFLMNEDIYWSSSNFSIYDHNGNTTYQITNQQEGMNLTAKEFVVQDATTGVKKLRVNAHVKACGFGQTYEADDGTTFRLDPRMFLSDRWYIKNPSAETEYVYKRAALSVDGKIYENERIVAQVTTHTNSTIASVSTKQMTLNSDGTIPPWDLIALLAIVKTRIHACGY